MKQETRGAERKMDLLMKVEAHPIMKKITIEEAEGVLGDRLLIASKLRAATEEAERVVPEYQRKVAALAEQLEQYDESRKVILDNRMI